MNANYTYHYLIFQNGLNLNLFNKVLCANAACIRNRICVFLLLLLTIPAFSQNEPSSPNCNLAFNLNFNPNIDDPSLGQPVLQSALGAETRLNVSDLKNGTYFYKIMQGDRLIKSERIIINK